MVAQTRFGPPNTASPARQKADPKTVSFIHAWIKDFPVESISSDADEITKKLKLLGIDSLASLSCLDDKYISVLETKGFNPIHAQLIVRDARALHETAPVALASSPKTALKPFPPWTEKMTGTHICCYLELLRWLTILLCFVEAHSDVLGPLLRLFMKDPGMNDSDYKTIHDQISEWCQRQLAATILSSIPSAMATLILSSLPDTFTADGLDILRAICRPHYGAAALKVKIEQATDLCFTNVPSVTNRNQLALALNSHLQSLEFLRKHGQGFGEDMAMRGLEILVKHLPLANEIEAARNIHENADKTWTLPDLTKILQKRATEWLLLTTVKEVAATSVPRNPSNQKRWPAPTCHKWLANGECTRKDCSFTHTPEHKGRSDLLPFCPHLDDKGKCNKLNCMFKHYPDVPLQQAQAPELAAAATQHNQHNSEMDELKAMISTLIKDGANQKALIAQLLEQDD
jgi:hypothetical protein